MQEECCCGQNNQSMGQCDCVSCGGVGYQRRYLTKAVKIELLNEYATEIRKELEGVEEKIEDLKIE